MTYRRALIGCAVLALSFDSGAAIAAGDQKADKPQQVYGRQPQEFVQKAGIAGLYEVQAAALARDRAQDGDVRKFAGEMTQDHGAANKELQLLSNQRQWAMPSTLDQKHQQLIDRLSSLKGAEFDREYVKQQLAAHEQAVSLFEQQARAGSDADLKKWASGKVDTLKAHLEHAQELASDSATSR